MILGIDVSTKSIGYGFISRNKLVNYGKISFGAGDQHSRFMQAVVALQRFKQRNRNYTLLVVEEPPFVNNKAVFGSLTMFYGLVVGSLYKQQLRVVTPKPLLWQQAIGNSLLTTVEKRGIISSNPGHTTNWYAEHGRRLRKQRTADWVHDKFGVTVTDDDVSDAIGIAYYGWLNASKR